MQVHFNTTVLGGFPVSVVAFVRLPESDVGIGSLWMEDFSLYTQEGKPAQWLVKRMSERDIARLEDEACEHV